MKKALSALLLLGMLLPVQGLCATAQTVYADSSSMIRSGPGLDYEIISTISTGHSVTYADATEVDERGVEWYKVYISSGTGWISSRYTTLSDGSYAPGTETVIGTVYADSSSMIRTGPGLDYEIVSSVSGGGSVPYIGDTSVDDRGVAWYKVRISAGTGWVSSRYTTLVLNDPDDGADTSTTIPDDATVTAFANANIRSGAGKEYNKIASLSAGYGLPYGGSTVTDARDVEWYSVRFGNDTAWISSEVAVLSGVTDTDEEDAAKDNTLFFFTTDTQIPAPTQEEVLAMIEAGHNITEGIYEGEQGQYEIYAYTSWGDDENWGVLYLNGAPLCDELWFGTPADPGTPQAMLLLDNDPMCRLVATEDDGTVLLYIDGLLYDTLSFRSAPTGG